MKQFTLLLDDDLYEIIEQWGHANDRSFSESCRHGLRIFFLPATSPEKAKRGRNIFEPPTVEEIGQYIIEKGYSFGADAFWGYYDSKGWKVGNQPMRNWRSACLTWQKRREAEGTARASLASAVAHPPMYTGTPSPPPCSPEQAEKNRDEMEKWERENLPPEQWRIAREEVKE